MLARVIPSPPRAGGSGCGPTGRVAALSAFSMSATSSGPLRMMPTKMRSQAMNSIR